MLWLAKNWELIAGGVLGIITSCVIFSYVLQYKDWKHAQDISNLKTEMIAACNKQKDLTSEKAYELQNELSRINREHNALKRLRSQCIVPAPRSRPSDDGQTKHTGNVGQNGITSDALLDYGKDAGTIELQLASCQSFICDVWKSQGRLIPGCH